ncbi:MAG TPA: 3-oxoacyl-[acyl-carrier-protein] synthase III C-terminal domain-containing protein [Polyangiaceae bacterium]|nr:3-oxoacyl-[acyl-carrier-protein] synthase III C-terminal domain-containing protein [Polyangiaceae bacterium]
MLSPRAENRRGPRVVASRSVFYPETEQVMGWEIGSQGLRVQLSAGVPELVREHIAPDVDAFLSEQGLARSNVQHWILHTGGPKVLEAFQDALSLSQADLEFSWNQLRTNGNLSSASVLLVLHDLWRARRPAPGSYGVVLAMGPGFCSEMVLLEW